MPARGGEGQSLPVYAGLEALGDRHTLGRQYAKTTLATSLTDMA